MKVYYFSEFPYHEYPEEEAEKYPSLRLTFPNTHFDPNTATDLFKRYFDLMSESKASVWFADGHVIVLPVRELICIVK